MKVAHLVCKQCGHGANDAVYDSEGKLKRTTGGATLRKFGDEYYCTVCRPQNGTQSRKLRREGKR